MTPDTTNVCASAAPAWPTAARRWTGRLTWVLVLWPAQQPTAGPLPLLSASDPLQRTPASGPPLENVPLGQQLLVENQCGGCHRIEGTSGVRGTRGLALVQWQRATAAPSACPNHELSPVSGAPNLSHRSPAGSCPRWT